ncbi:MAG: cysteine desulfurase family protein [Bacilli bacterium]
MIYLDYSATTPVNKEVLKTFDAVTLDYIGNPNSLHKLGTYANNIIKSSTKQIADLLNIKEEEIIYTSGSSEANNLALKGTILKYQNRGKHIITTNFEHSSIYGPLNYLQKLGFEVDFVKTDKDGIVDLDNLKSLLRDDTILVSVGMVNSEIGILQPVNEIGLLLKEYPKCFYHVDMTQGLGKVRLDLTNIDMASFSAHKIYGIKGIGFLYKKASIVIEPLIHGGKSTTIYRSGTPTTGLIVSLAKAMRLALEDLDGKYEKVSLLKNYLIEQIKPLDGVYINSNTYCIPHIVNLSVIGVKPETMLHALENDDIYISTQTACAGSASVSSSVLALTNDHDKASSSIRISLSSLTTKEEIDYFVKSFKKCCESLRK